MVLGEAGEMLAGWTFRQDDAVIPNTASWILTNTSGVTYQIRVSWPLCWTNREVHNQRAHTIYELLAIYLVDGDSTFGSATEAIRRRRPYADSQIEAIVVAVGYHLTDSVLSPRRDFDLTPPSPTYSPPEGPDGTPRPRPHGGADRFLDFLQHIVRPFVYSTVFPNIGIEREALFGHSYGGLFVLHALFTRPSSFDTFIAASPSIWWNDQFILEEERRYCETLGTEARPVLRLSYGSLEQSPARRHNQSPGDYEQLLCNAAKRRMADNCTEMYQRIQQTNQLPSIELREYKDEDHLGVVAAALNGVTIYFLET